MLSSDMQRNRKTVKDVHTNFTQWAWYRAVTRIRLIVTFVSPPLFVPPKFYYCRLLTRSKFVMTSYLLFVNCGLRDQTKPVVVSGVPNETAPQKNRSAGYCRPGWQKKNFESELAGI